MSKLYIYGIMANQPDITFDGRAVDNPTAEVQTLNFEGFDVIVSEIESDEVLPLRRNMMAHTKILEAALAETAVLPMQFGVIMDSQDLLEKALKTAKHNIQANLDALQDTIEVGIKATWDQDRVLAEIAKDSPHLLAQGQVLGSKSENESYYERIELGRKVDAELSRRKSEEMSKIISLIETEAVQMKMLDLTTDMMICNLAALVKRDAAANLEAKIEAYGQAKGEDALVKYIAPVPAYNFVSLRIDWSPESAKQAAA